jgi:hypothetical protein
MLLMNLEGSISFHVTHWLTKVYVKRDVLTKEVQYTTKLRCNMLPIELALDNSPKAKLLRTAEARFTNVCSSQRNISHRTFLSEC